MAVQSWVAVWQQHSKLIANAFTLTLGLRVSVVKIF